MSDDTKAPEVPRSNQIIKEVLGGSAAISVLAVVLALVFGGILMVLTDETVAQTSAYFFSRPGDMLGAMWDAPSSSASSAGHCGAVSWVF